MLRIMLRRIMLRRILCSAEIRTAKFHSSAGRLVHQQCVGAAPVLAPGAVIKLENSLRGRRLSRSPRLSCCSAAALSQDASSHSLLLQRAIPTSLITRQGGWLTDLVSKSPPP